MKISGFRLVGLLATILPMMASAQSNIESAFDRIIKYPGAKITESHTLDKDPSTKTKIGQSDVYNFVLPGAEMRLINNVIKAFDKDDDMAYSIKRGKNTPGEADIVLAVGDGSGSGVQLGDRGSDYIYALFLAPASEDPDGNYRYAYAMSYKKDGDKLVGKLIKTYATTLKYRQQQEKERQYAVLRNFSGETYAIPDINSSQKTWFERIMMCFQSMTSANNQTRIALATKVYSLIVESAKYPEVTETDKNTVREILKGMISDKKYSESVLNRLLEQCLAALK